MKSLVLFVLFVIAGSAVAADSTYYVDGDWTGAESGTQSEPWQTINWSTVNTSLASGNVTIYLSAREAGSDTDDSYDNGDADPDVIDFDNRTDTSANRLTVSGNEKWNSNDSTPSWSDYTGNSKCRVQKLDAQNGTLTRRSNITMRGMHVIQDAADKCVTINGNNVILENCDIEHTDSATDGPCVQINPTADGSHEGSSEPAPRLTNIVIRANSIHDTHGEAIYIGGGGSPPLTDAGAGYPSHSQIYVTNNFIYRAGRYDGQGDGIDFKGGLTDLYISYNVISNIGLTGNPVRGIVGQGQTNGATANIVIERNRLVDIDSIEDGAIVIADSWGVADGVTIRNNIIDTCSTGVGILLYDTQDEAAIYNNIIYNCSAHAMDFRSGAIVNVRNNIVADNNSGGAQVTVAATVNAWDYNAWTDTLGYGTPGANSINLGANANAVFVNEANGDFRHEFDSPCLNTGVSIGSFSDDFNGTVTRPLGTAWDIGAYEQLLPFIQAVTINLGTLNIGP